MTPERLKELSAAFAGCGDNSCLVKKPIGMATNGGCRCFGERSVLKKVSVIAEMARELITALEFHVGE